jgi:hypothetical protein
VGGQFQVNTYTTSFQAVPSVATDADGDFVVVWQSEGSPGNDASFSSVQGRRYASNGSAVGGQFQVNTYTTSVQYAPVVASQVDRDFVVVWYSNGSPGDDSASYSIQGQRYASDGSAAGDQFQVNAYTTSFQVNPFVAADADGDFVVVWWSFGSPGNDASDGSVQGRRYASDGAAVGTQFQVNAYTTGYQVYPSVAAAPDGDFVVVWSNVDTSSGSDASGYSIQGQRFSVPEPSLPLSHALAGAAAALLARRLRRPTTAPRRSGRRAP